MSHIARIVDEDLFLGNKIAEAHGHIQLSRQASGIQFKPISEQPALKAMQLTANHIPLDYQLIENNTKIIAHQSNTQQPIFTAQIDTTGAYHFSLLHPIDKPADINLLDTIQPIPSVQTHSILYNNIKTTSNKIYQLSFNVAPLDSAFAHIPRIGLEIWWGGLLIAVVHMIHETWKGYNFSVSSDNINHSDNLHFSALEFRIQDPSLAVHHIHSHIQDLQLIDTAQKNLTLDFAFEDNLNTAIHGELPVIINIDHAVYIDHINPDSSLTIIVDETSPYKKIILPEETSNTPTPVTILSLDKIFNELNIPEESRKVDIRQLDHHGLPGPIYEVNISDSHDSNMAPITVADIRLGFPGGDSGLDIFYKNISIDF